MRNNNEVQSERFLCEVRALPKLFSSLNCAWGTFIEAVTGKNSEENIPLLFCQH